MMFRPVSPPLPLVVGPLAPQIAVSAHCGRALTKLVVVIGGVVVLVICRQGVCSFGVEERDLCCVGWSKARMAMGEEKGRGKCGFQLFGSSETGKEKKRVGCFPPEPTIFFHSKSVRKYERKWK